MVPAWRGLARRALLRQPAPPDPLAGAALRRGPGPPSRLEDVGDGAAERQGAGIACLRACLQRVIAGALDVAEAALQSIRPVEAGTASQFHGQFGRFDGMTGHE